MSGRESSLQVASNITINVALKVGSVTQTVQVESDATMVGFKDNSIAEVLDTKARLRPST